MRSYVMKYELRVLQCEKEVKSHSTRMKIDSSLNYSLKMKAHRVHSTCWKLLQMKGHLQPH